MATNANADLYALKPSNIYKRLRRGTLDPEVARELLGGKPIEEWDLEELARGRPRHEVLGWGGPRPAWLTDEMVKEADRLFHRRIREDINAAAVPALKTIMTLVREGDSDRVKLDAAKFIFDHVIGKPTQELKHSAGEGLESLLAGMLVNPDGEEAVDIIDVEPEEADDEPDDDLEDLT